MTAAAPRTAVVLALARAAPSQDGLRLIVSGMVYLLAICVLQVTAFLSSAGQLGLSLPSNALEVRDVVALFGWVGLMISGVSVIIVPNHLRVRIRPVLLPRAHLVTVDGCLAGFLGTALLWPSSWVSGLFLAGLSLSFLAFGLGVLATVAPFVLRGRRSAAPPSMTRQDIPAGSQTRV